jgi:hypothetical protein
VAGEGRGLRRLKKKGNSIRSAGKIRPKRTGEGEGKGRGRKEREVDGRGGRDRCGEGAGGCLRSLSGFSGSYGVLWVEQLHVDSAPCD